MEIKQCVICNEDFILKVHNQKICWKECRRLLNNKMSVIRDSTPEWKERKKILARKDYEKHKEKIKERVRNWKPYKHICRECWIEFNDWRKNSKFCGKKCSYKNSKISRLWKNNPSYRNWFYSWTDRSDRLFKEKDFVKTCKELDKKQINDKWYLYCEFCWTSNTLRFEHHHLVYRSEKPKHEYLHDIRNIFMCCIKCHNDFHRHKSKRNEIVKERELNLLFWDDILNK